MRPGFGPAPGWIGLGPRTEAAGVIGGGRLGGPSRARPGTIHPGTQPNRALWDTPTGAPGADREKPRLVEKGGPAHGLAVSYNVSLGWRLKGPPCCPPDLRAEARACRAQARAGGAPEPEGRGEVERCPVQM